MSDFVLPDGRWGGWAEAARTWRQTGAVDRLFRRDPTLWTNSGEERWLAWLDVADRQLAALDAWRGFRDAVAERGFADILLLGMGGSSLCPDVFSKTFPRPAGFPRLRVVDSTDPEQVMAAAEAVDLTRTLVFVSSKSGSTLEPDLLRRYFFDRVGRAIGGPAGDRFVAVTDPGSQLEEIAREDGYWRIFFGEPEIGGRFSALSAFGMAPAAAMGLDVEALLRGAARMTERCRSNDIESNPGVALGLLLGGLAKAGRDKLTLLASPGLDSLGGWIEQLVAESTGKGGQAIVPVDREAPGRPEVYGDDRVFVLLRLGGEEGPEAEARALEAAGHPLARLVCPTREELGAEMYRWEIATAVAGAAMGLNPFDQPDVEASKIKTKRLMRAVEETGSIPEEHPFYSEPGVELYADDRNAAVLQAATLGAESLESLLRAHFDRLQPGRYFGLLAYLPMTPENEAALTELRTAVRDARRAATCLGFGPRFLHSTGQAYKGGPNTGVFLQVTAAPARDAEAPGKGYTFGAVEAAQARGDLEVLDERKRRTLRVHLAERGAGLARLVEAGRRAAAR